MCCPGRRGALNALFALGSAIFYGLLARLERSRILGAFGSIAANLALLMVSLSQGLGGADIYLAPLGLCMLVIVHLFEGSLTADARGGLRLAATALTYAPAAITLVLQIGNAQSDWYPLAFAGACLIGIAGGMWFHIRAYLVLGLAFLIIDLGSLLIRASLHSQRLGFFVLSLTGLLDPVGHGDVHAIPAPGEDPRRTLAPEARARDLELVARALGAAARGLDRVALGVSLQLGGDRLAQIEPDAIAQQQERDADVGNLGGDAGARRRLARACVGLVAAHPAVLGQQLAGLGRDQHRQVLGIVELAPVARVGERAQRRGELVEGRHCRDATA